jgi:hypothetical protein
MRSSLTITILALLAVLPLAVAQPQLISDHPAVRAAVEKFVAEQAANTITPGKGTGARYAATSPVFGGGYSLATPPVALRLNRLQYDERDVFQASLVVLSKVTLPTNNPVGLSVLWIHLDSDYFRGTYAGQHVLLAGESIPLQTYVFDGNEPSGVYALVVMVIDMTSGQLLAMPGTHFAFRTFRRTDTRGYLRVDNAEAQGQFVILQGNFLSEATPGQFALIGNQKFPIVKSSGTTAVVDLGSAYALPAGMHDITLVFHTAGNTAYDSTTAPCVLRLFLLLPSSKKD